MSLRATAENRIAAAVGVNWSEEFINNRRVAHFVQTRVMSRPTNVALWIVQGLLAALFLFAGSTKLILPIEVLSSMGSPNQILLPGWFIRFIGVAEVLGAIGLILPRLL